MKNTNFRVHQDKYATRWQQMYGLVWVKLVFIYIKEVQICMFPLRTYERHGGTILEGDGGIPLTGLKD